MSDARPCGGSNANVCPAEGCDGEACVHAAIERSSLGTPAAKAARASVSDTAAARVVGMADGMASEQARILALLTDPAVVEEVARAHYGDRWAEECGLWRARRLDDMAAALDVLRARIEEDR